MFLFAVDYVGPDSCYVDKAFYFLIHYKNDRLCIAVGCLETAKMNQQTCQTVIWLSDDEWNGEY